MSKSVELVLADLRTRIGQEIDEELLDELHEHLHEVIANAGDGEDHDDDVNFVLKDVTLNPKSVREGIEYIREKASTTQEKTIEVTPAWMMMLADLLESMVQQFQIGKEPRKFRVQLLTEDFNTIAMTSEYRDRYEQFTVKYQHDPDAGTSTFYFSEEAPEAEVMGFMKSQMQKKGREKNRV